MVFFSPRKRGAVRATTPPGEHGIHDSPVVVLPPQRRPTAAADDDGEGPPPNPKSAAGAAAPAPLPVVGRGDGLPGAAGLVSRSVLAWRRVCAGLLALTV